MASESLDASGADLPPELADGLRFAVATYVKGFDALHRRTPTEAELRQLFVSYEAVLIAPTYRKALGDPMGNTMDLKMAIAHFNGRPPLAAYEDIVTTLVAGLGDSEREMGRAAELSVRWLASGDVGPIFPHALTEAVSRKVGMRPTRPVAPTWTSSGAPAGKRGCSVLLAILSLAGILGMLAAQGC